MPPAFLKAQIQAVVEDIGVDAVKLGMLHAPEVVEVVAWAIDHYKLPNVVLDPVMVATSGDRLIAAETVEVLVRELFPRAVVVTPNLDEAALLIGHAIDGVDALDDAAGELLALGAHAVLLKGGHLPGDDVVDLLAEAGGERAAAGVRRASRAATCTARAARCRRPSPRTWRWATRCPRPCERARGYVVAAMAAGADVKVGAGHGPLNHGFAPVPTVRLPSTDA